jgi:hypothetical protein
MEETIEFDVLTKITQKQIKQKDLQLEFKETKFGIPWYSESK